MKEEGWGYALRRPRLITPGDHHRTLYANTCGDFQVRYPTAAISPSPPPNFRKASPLDPIFPHIIEDTEREVKLTVGLIGDEASEGGPSTCAAYFDRDSASQTLRSMLDRLDSVGWRRITVRLLAHDTVMSNYDITTKMLMAEGI